MVHGSSTIVLCCLGSVIMLTGAVSHAQNLLPQKTFPDLCNIILADSGHHSARCQIDEAIASIGDELRVTGFQVIATAFADTEETALTEKLSELFMKYHAPFAVAITSSDECTGNVSIYENGGIEDAKKVHFASLTFPMSRDELELMSYKLSEEIFLRFGSKRHSVSPLPETRLSDLANAQQNKEMIVPTAIQVELEQDWYEIVDSSTHWKPGIFLNGTAASAKLKISTEDVSKSGDFSDKTTDKSNVAYGFVGGIRATRKAFFADIAALYYLNKEKHILDEAYEIRWHRCIVTWRAAYGQKLGRRFISNFGLAFGIDFIWLSSEQIETPDDIQIKWNKKRGWGILGSASYELAIIANQRVQFPIQALITLPVVRPQRINCTILEYDLSTDSTATVLGKPRTTWRIDYEKTIHLTIGMLVYF